MLVRERLFTSARPVGGAIKATESPTKCHEIRKWTLAAKKSNPCMKLRAAAAATDMEVAAMQAQQQRQAQGEVFVLQRYF